MRPLRVDVQAVLFASLGLVSLLAVCCTLYDPRLLAVRSYLAPYKDRFLAQVSYQYTCRFHFRQDHDLLRYQKYFCDSLDASCLLQRVGNASSPSYQRPLDVRDWTCKDVAWWMGSQVHIIVSATRTLMKAECNLLSKGYSMAH